MPAARLVIVGAGGFAREVAEIARLLRPDSRLGFVDDAPQDDATRLMTGKGAHHLGAARSWQPEDSDTGVIAIGDPGIRAALAALLGERGAVFDVLVHPDATIARSATLHPGVIVAPGARVSADVVLGHHVHIDQNATVGHDTIVGAYSRLNPAACLSGAVVVGEGAYIGAAAVVLQGLTVGAGCIIGAGAVAVSDVEPGTTVKGVPAR
ncbi:acetyltransferase [Knoellia sp. S7-12]|uniref:acetyltransferase n=1 Tax=Knoellia sp. S7-12 TaxID=3126698 RepID=UPI003366B659